MTEPQIATVCKSVLQSLVYLHDKGKKTSLKNLSTKKTGSPKASFSRQVAEASRQIPSRSACLDEIHLDTHIWVSRPVTSTILHYFLALF